MSIKRRIETARNLTPTETQMAHVVLDMGDRLQSVSIKEFARAAHVSIASVHRFCKKLGLEGFKELKVEIARSMARQGRNADVDINFPFGPDEETSRIVSTMGSVYAATVRDTSEVLDIDQLERATELIGSARKIGIFTQSHNLHPAQMFCDRLLSIGRDAFCHQDVERQYRSALVSDERDVAVFISYSGLAPDINRKLALLTERNVPVVYIGTAAARRRHPGLAAYLLVGDREHLQERITQFASHISVQFVLDILFSCVFAADYDRSATFLKGALPYTHLPVPPE